MEHHPTTSAESIGSTRCLREAEAKNSVILFVRVPFMFSLLFSIFVFFSRALFFVFRVRFAYYGVENGENDER